MLDTQTVQVVSDQSVQLVVSKLEALANKLGVTAEFIFKVYTKQAYIEAIRDGFITFLLCCATFGLAYGSYRLVKYAKEDSCDEWPFMMGGIGGLLSIGGLVWIFCNIWAILGEALNPQFWALQNIFQSIK